MSARLNQPQEIFQATNLYSGSQIFYQTAKLQVKVSLISMPLRLTLFQLLLSLVVAKWRVHSQSKITKPDPRDFKKLNKMSLKEGKITAPGQYEFRSSHDARIAFGIINEKSIMLPGDDFTFGKPNRVQTPVGGIISNMYGERASDDL